MASGLRVHEISAVINAATSGRVFAVQPSSAAKSEGKPLSPRTNLTIQDTNRLMRAVKVVTTSMI